MRREAHAQQVVTDFWNPTGPEQQVIDAHTAQTLRTLIAELPPRRRRLLSALFTDHPASYAELSRATGIPLGSIGPPNRALHQLRQNSKITNFPHRPSTKPLPGVSRGTCSDRRNYQSDDPHPARTEHLTGDQPHITTSAVLDERRRESISPRCPSYHAGC